MMTFIGARLPFTQEEYPGIDLTPEGRLKHAVRHGALHMMKSTGKIASQAETADHGGAMDILTIKKTTASMLISTLNLAKELGMSSEELAFEVARALNET